MQEELTYGRYRAFRSPIFCPSPQRSVTHLSTSLKKMLLTTPPSSWWCPGHQLVNSWLQYLTGLSGQWELNWHSLLSRLPTNEDQQGKTSTVKHTIHEVRQYQSVPHRINCPASDHWHLSSANHQGNHHLGRWIFFNKQHHHWATYTWCVERSHLYLPPT